MNSKDDDWINQALGSVGIRSNAFLPVMGGLLVHIKGEGIIWIPRARIAGILSKSGLLDSIARYGQYAFSAIGFIFAPIATAYSQFIRRGFRIPPNIVTSYSRSIIEQVIITHPTLHQKFAFALVGAKEKAMKIIRKASPEKEEEDATYYALRIIVTLEEISVNKDSDMGVLSKISDTIKTKLEGLHSETSETQPEPLDVEFQTVNLEDETLSVESETNEQTGKLAAISRRLKGAKVKLEEKGAVAKEKLVETGGGIKEKMVDVKDAVSEKMSKITLKKVLRWLQAYPLFRVRLATNEMDRLSNFIKSLQEDSIEVYYALELEDELSAGLMKELNGFS